MIILLVVLGIVFASICGIFGYPFWVDWKRDRIKNRPFPDQWQATLETTLPLYPCLSSAQQSQLRKHIHVLLAEKQFIGCNGLTITEEMTVVIAAIASLLLFHQHHQYFPKLRTILIYPSAYRVKQKVDMGSGVIQEHLETRLGESWSRDQLVLAWDQVQRDIKQWKDGRNVVLHEFAHQLDQADGKAEGVPILTSPQDYDAWTRVMTQEYKQLCRAIQRGHRTVLDPYGTLNPAEFFAVATETFFEKPTQLFKNHSSLYQQLQNYYQIDPASMASASH